MNERLAKELRKYQAKLIENLSDCEGKTITSVLDVWQDDAICIKFTDDTSLYLKPYENYGTLSIDSVCNLGIYELFFAQIIDEKERDRLLSIKEEISLASVSANEKQMLVRLLKKYENE